MGGGGVEGGKLRGGWRYEQLAIYFVFKGVLGGSMHRRSEVCYVFNCDGGVEYF